MATRRAHRRNDREPLLINDEEAIPSYIITNVEASSTLERNPFVTNGDLFGTSSSGNKSKRCCTCLNKGKGCSRGTCCVCIGITVFVTLLILSLLWTFLVPVLAASFAKSNIQATLKKAEFGAPQADGLMVKYALIRVEPAPISVTLSAHSATASFFRNSSEAGDGLLLGTVTVKQDVKIDATTGECTCNNTFLDISDTREANLAHFAEIFLHNEHVYGKLCAKTTVWAWNFLPLPNVNFCVNFTTHGMNGVSDVTFSDLKLGPVDEKMGAVVVTTSVHVKNPSKLSMNIGDDSFAVLYRNSVMGTVSARNVSLHPGDNGPFPLEGFIRPANNDIAGEFFSRYIGGESSDIQIKVLQAGPAAAPWYQNAVSGEVLDEKLPGVKDPSSFLRDVAFVALSFEFVGDKLSCNITARVLIDTPNWNFNVSVTQIEMTADMVYEGKRAGTIVLPWCKAKSKVVKGNPALHEVITTAENIDVAYDFNIMSDVLADLFLMPNVTLELQGAAGAATSSILGTINVQGIPFAVSTTFTGANGFAGDKFRIQSLSIVAGKPGFGTVSAHMSAYDPSIAGASMGDVTLDVLVMNEYVGNVTLPSPHIEHGWNEFEHPLGVLVQTKTNTKARQAFISNYVTGVNTPVVVKGNVDGVENALLKKAMSQLVIDTHLDGLKQPLVDYVQIRVELVWIYGVVTLHNPFLCDMHVTGVNFNIYHRKDTRSFLVGSCDEQFENPVFVPGNATSKTPEIQVTVDWRGIDWTLFCDIVTATEFFLDVNGTVSLDVDKGYVENDLYYFQNDVKAAWFDEFSKPWDFCK